MKQTAVDWLIKEFNLEQFEASIRFAKSMEQSNIKRAFIDGEQNAWDRSKKGHKFEFDNTEDYYEKKFNK